VKNLVKATQKKLNCWWWLQWFDLPYGKKREAKKITWRLNSIQQCNDREDSCVFCCHCLRSYLFSISLVCAILMGKNRVQSTIKSA
jgi:hypothetical protein